MQLPAIEIGTILQNRYRLTGILGQGGFGRTYLAEDQGRFNERCALKELIPSQGGPDTLKKARELFQREAAALYQIQHPQIPQFRATFEEGQRLFLVQDYVQGKNYRELLNERRSNGQTFSEPEILQFLQQILPVLAHIHSKGIIHRDISPDNIILRESDRLPVLIDFGVVKEIATRIQSPGSLSAPATAVGKSGYAPVEQIQTGEVYPSSDLYSLAVTAVVLLTGKEAGELFDVNQLNWQFSRWVNLNHGFAQILNRMLSYRPDDRYQSANEVLQQLMLLTPGNPIPSYQPPSPILQPPDPKASDMQTIAVGGRPIPISQPPDPNPQTLNPNRPNRPDAVIPEPTTRTPWQDPWAIVGLGTCLALLAGFGSWAIVSTIVNRQKPEPSPTSTIFATPTTIPTTSPTPTSTPTASTPIPSSEPSTFSQKLDIVPGQTISKDGNLKANSTISYIFRGEQGQKLDTFLTSEGVLMTVLGPDKNPISDQAKRVLGWKSTLPFTGDYTIQLSPIKGLKDSNYKLSVNVAKPDSVASPTVSPTTSPTKSPTTSPTKSPTTSPTKSPTTSPTKSPSGNEFDTETLKIQEGIPFQAVGSTNQKKVKRYLVNVKSGQTLEVTATTPGVTLDIRKPDGSRLENATGVTTWKKLLKKGGNYQIDVIAIEPTNFTLDVSLSK